ncbi:FAD-dependent oxidoreductase [Cyclobacterium jeungdonense]|uniref:D-amino-acid oxidase n=1 Tax=Cyclobacterium jeungdonense TaxID=708087 RepID=A0ABT8CFF0_9BACT|nr:FAD-dependent oxidoreductase [Cyclobacterium jeungdonense]MDN3690283.1 FAD-dependent oxidoreductase [Cyclobacterium jeungdonense]
MIEPRRDFIRKVGLAALGTGCFSNSLLAEPLANNGNFEILKKVRLPEVKVSSSRVIKESVGLRPFRRSGPRIEAQEFGNKLLIHNYGHGGSGWSLSWGSAMLACELVPQDPGLKKIGVMGCGVLGLSTARTLQNKGYQVTIYTKDVYPNVTSAMATGTWSPSHKLIEPGKITPEFQEKFERAYFHSYYTYQRMLGLNQVVNWMDNYSIKTTSNTNSEAKPTGPGLKDGLITEEMDFYPKGEPLSRRENPFKFKNVTKNPTTIFNIPSYLKMLTNDFLLTGGKLEIKEFNRIEDVDSLPEKCIVNCTGLGSMKLFGDEDMLPVSGQLCFLIPQPELNYRANMSGVYVIPRRDGIMLGGNHIEGNWDTSPDPAVKDKFLTTVEAMMDRLKG